MWSVSSPSATTGASCGGTRPPDDQPPAVAWEVVRAPLAIPAELGILGGLAVGYPDPNFPANRLPISREAVGKNVVCLDSASGERSDRQGERSQTGPWPTLWDASRRSLANATGVGCSRMRSLVSLTFTRRRSDCCGGLSSRRPVLEGL